jgi:crossover junction endodeoxyribonuclease RuvC
MLQRILKITKEDMPKFMDATDALAAAYCHFMQTNAPISTGKKYSSWKDFATKNKERVANLIPET